MIVMSLSEIKQQLNLEDAKSFSRIVEAQEQGFAAYSKGDVVGPDVFHMVFDPPHPGDLHVKGARTVGGEFYVIKIATGFGKNPTEFGILTSQGLMIAGSAKTGKPLIVLEDDGFLTDLRTALAGLIAAKFLGPKKVSAIGVLGTGGQARLQVQHLKSHTPCREVYVWGRNAERVDQYRRDMEKDGYVVHPASTPAEVAQNCNLIVTTTAATEFLLHAEDVRPGTHITAMGTDAPGKQELDPQIFAKAAIRAVDSKSQCVHHGDTHYAIEQKIITENELVELGQVIADPARRRTKEDSITIADLTGVGVQDLQIAAAVASPRLENSK